ncbi:LLM class flavin-dependent oxidoreductase [Amycolatopsis pigmentata]|uniref:LLM class flavin-dependent oxidoreductase n=1 Tax=Amycolatopsis pigmentata TaxID=450801 RepID=A0ABW5FLX5_9PSEU
MTPPMELGLALDLGTDPSSGGIADQIRRAAPLLTLAEQAGFTSVWLGESYHTAPAPFHLPSALMVLAHLAPMTKLGLGTGVLLARAHHPDRLATEAALVDQLSEGRLTLGIGLGADGLKGVLGGLGQAGGPMFEAMLARLRTLWRERPAGTYVPAPYRTGGPPILIGGRGPVAARRAATLADGYYSATNYSDRLLAAQSTAYLEALAAHNPHARPSIAVNRVCIVDSDGATARNHAEEHLARLHHYYRSLNAWDIGRADGDPEPVLVGTPTEIIARLRHYRSLGVTHVQARIAPAGMPEEVIRRTITELGEHVIPNLRALDAGHRFTQGTSSA